MNYISFILLSSIPVLLSYIFVFSKEKNNYLLSIEVFFLFICYNITIIFLFNALKLFLL